MPPLKPFLTPTALTALTLALAFPNLGFSAANSLSADTKKSERKYRTTITGEGALTQQMIETCIMLKTEIDEEYEKINASKKVFEVLNNEVKKLGAEVPNKDNVSLIEYNKQVNFYNNKLNELKKLEAAYNKKSGPYLEKTTQLKKECNDQSHYQDDYAAAVKKTGKTLSCK